MIKRSILFSAVALSLPAYANAAMRWPAADDRALYAGAVAALYMGFCGVVIHRERRRRQRTEAAFRSPHNSAAPIVVAFASQTGFAEQLARRTAESLHAAGTAVQLCPLAQLDAAALRGAKRALFIVSTTGEGDAPDSAAGFARRVMRDDTMLDGLKYGVLALGDRGYRHYCAFGHTLDQWLRHQNAQPLFDAVEVDNGDEGALRHWQHHLGVLSGQTGMADWKSPRYEQWRLIERRHLNPGSPGAPTFHVTLAPLAGHADWQAGDIAEIGPCNPPERVQRFLDALQLDGAITLKIDGEHEVLAHRQLPDDASSIEALRHLPPDEILLQLAPLPHREYSIASLPADGRLELVIRQMQQPDGELGLGSGWLTAHAQVGGEIALRVRRNSSFHAPAHDCPLILIGNGTGIAGLRAHLKARLATGRHRNWLLFGERTAAHDYYFGTEIEALRANGLLQRVDLAFSRDQSARVYVQDRLREAASELREWIARGAAIYVCGSLDGMATGVDAALKAVLGQPLLEHLVEEGRYRRDVY